MKRDRQVNTVWFHYMKLQKIQINQWWQKVDQHFPGLAQSVGVRKEKQAGGKITKWQEETLVGGAVMDMFTVLVVVMLS